MSKPKVIAFYLPQFHPIPENDIWWGKGFTEWTNVAKAKPLFRGHQQPNVPSELGFYDLRLSESRVQQAALAKEYGVDAFCYWHYWFGNGKELLEKPLQQVVADGKPDFPFCLGWANHHWEKKSWNGDISVFDRERLIAQEYPGEQDHIDHFYRMLDTFKDRRYYRIHGKMLFFIYDVKGIPNIKDFISLWQALAQENDLPGFYFIGYARNETSINYCFESGLDGVLYDNLNSTLSDISVNKHRIQNIFATILKKPFSVMSYEKFINKLDYSPVTSNERIYPSIFPNWDTSPRRGVAGEILVNATPKLFQRHVTNVATMMSSRDPEDNIIFLKSWNEWAEGNYVEPDLQYGRGRLEALKTALKK